MTGPNRRAFLGFMLVLAVLVPWLGGSYYPWPYQRQFVAAARRYGLSPYLLAAVARSESRFDPSATSERGAVGLMQVMPATGRSLAKGSDRRGARLRSPKASIELGARYLKQLDGEFHATTAALAAYNGGETVVAGWIGHGVWRPGQPLSRIPYGETRDFVARVERFAAWYDYLYPGYRDPGDAGSSATASSTR